MNKHQLEDELVNITPRIFYKDDLYFVTEEVLRELIRVNKSITSTQLDIKRQMIEVINSAFYNSLDKVDLFLKSYEEIEKIYLKVRRISKEQFRKEVLKERTDDKEYGLSYDDYEEKLLTYNLIFPNNIRELMTLQPEKFEMLLENLDDETDIKLMEIEKMLQDIHNTILELEECINEAETSSIRSEYVAELALEKLRFKSLQQEKENLLRSKNEAGGRK